MLARSIKSGIKQLIIAAIIGLTLVAFAPSALAADIPNGAAVFSVHCAGCHANGGNIVRRGKTLKQKALEKNGMDSLEAIGAIVANGKNNMSAYQDRLSKQQIQDVAAYVLEQASQGWH